jgi:Leucine-rich repeat (LRR) protein
VLNGNGITTIESGTFNGLSSLRKLRLQENGITTIESGAFNGLSSLSELNLNDNGITTIESGAFNGPSYLDYFDLTDNCIDRDLLSEDILSQVEDSYNFNWSTQYVCLDVEYSPSGSIT